MFLLKNKKAPSKVFKGTVQQMLEEMVQGTGIILSKDTAKTSVGEFRVFNETVAQVLERLRKDYRFTPISGATNFTHQDLFISQRTGKRLNSGFKRISLNRISNIQDRRIFLLELKLFPFLPKSLRK